MLATRTFARSADEVAHARDFAAGVVARAGLPPSDDLGLVVSELVSNAVLHGEGAIELQVDLRADRVHVEVHDDGCATPAVPPSVPDVTALGGRGLGLVRAMSRAWGSTLDERGRTTVWADINRSDARRPEVP